jgi:hypothetical protein
VFVKLHHHPNAVLIVEMRDNNGGANVDLAYYFMWVKPCSIEGASDGEDDGSGVPRTCLKALTMVELDPFLLTNGPGTAVVDVGKEVRSVFRFRYLWGSYSISRKM